MRENTNIITSVRKNSIAEELGIEPGDILVSINGQAVTDIIEYKYLISDEYIELLIRKHNGEEWTLEIEKEYDEDLGIFFENPIIDKARSCANKCVFCFIDQLPKGMRPTLYFKDDDSRLSFLQGNFITMTNMSDRDIDRIIKYRISPLNISVHTTDPDLRIKMLGNKRAGKILENIRKLSDGGITINCQIVLCRGINDGDVLRKTVKDLFQFYPSVRNIAVVPVGISRYRDRLYPLVPFDTESAGGVIDLIEEMQSEIIKKTGDVFVRAADEFYILANRKLPDPKHYGEYEQLEDGIGMMTYFIQNVNESLKHLYVNKLDLNVTAITGVLSYKYIKDVFNNIEDNIEGLKANVYPIKNNFFGEKITVTGLLTGKDIIEQLSGKELGQLMLIPSNLLKAGEEILLDDISVGTLEEKLGVKIKVCRFDGRDLLQRLCGKEES